MELLAKLSSAQDNSERRKLAHEVVKLYFHTGATVSDEQKDAFSEVLCNLLNDLGQDMQLELSNKVSETNDAHSDLVRKLAFSSAETAAPVLTRSAQLNEEDLIQVANNATIDHRLAISKREFLSENVTDSLIKFEENVVMRSVAENETASISDKGFSTLARNSKNDEKMFAALVGRQDLPEHTAQQILENADEREKIVLEKLVSSGGNLLGRMIKKAEVLVAENSKAGKAHQEKPDALIRQIQSDSGLLEPTLLKLYEQSRLNAIACVFAAISKLGEEEVTKGIVNVDGSFLALISRANDISFELYNNIDKLRTMQLRIPSKNENQLFQQYNDLDPDTARSTMRMVNVISKVG